MRQLLLWALEQGLGLGLGLSWGVTRPDTELFTRYSVDRRAVMDHGGRSKEREIIMAWHDEQWLLWRKGIIETVGRDRRCRARVALA